MRIAIAVSLAAGITAGSAPTFAEWRNKHKKAYASREELQMRRAVFAANVAKIEAHNGDASATFRMAVNKFADLTADEFSLRFASGGRAARLARQSRRNYASIPVVGDLPASVDWVSKGAVTPVKNQGQCGSCWSFSVTGAVEGLTFLKTGSLPSLSEQQLVDCSSSAGNLGCNGGEQDWAFAWIMQNGGICSEAAYPYTGVDGTCKQCTSVAKIANYTDVPNGNQTALEAAIAQQPIAVSVDANGGAWQFYSSGVLTSHCGKQLDHAVLATGYGTDSTGQDYYTIKNSWGTDWGLNGYILLARGSAFNPDGQCGVQTGSSYPTL